MRQENFHFYDYPVTKPVKCVSPGLRESLVVLSFRFLCQDLGPSTPQALHAFIIYEYVFITNLFHLDVFNKRKRFRKNI